MHNHITFATWFAKLDMLNKITDRAKKGGSLRFRPWNVSPMDDDTRSRKNILLLKYLPTDLILFTTIHKGGGRE